MTILRSLCLVLLLSSACLAQSASPSSPDAATPARPAAAEAPKFPEVDAEIQNDIYTNRYFGFSMKFPEGWRALDWGTLIAAAKEGIKKQDAEDSQLGLALDSAAQMNNPKVGLMLLTTMPKDGSGPMMLILTQELSPELKVHSVDDYLTLATIPLTQMKFTLLLRPETFVLGGKQFSRIELLAPDKVVKEAMVVTIIKDHVLGIIVIGEEDAKNRGYEVLKTMKFTESEPQKTTPAKSSK